jgi:hypothetical protein
MRNKVGAGTATTQEHEQGMRDWITRWLYTPAAEGCLATCALRASASTHSSLARVQSTNTTGLVADERLGLETTAWWFLAQANAVETSVAAAHRGLADGRVNFTTRQLLILQIQVVGDRCAQCCESAFKILGRKSKALCSGFIMLYPRLRAVLAGGCAKNTM